MLVNKSKNKSKTKLFHSVLAIMILGVVGFSTVSINKTYATEVHPTIIKTSQSIANDDSAIKNTIGNLISQFVVFIKEGVEKNNQQYQDQINSKPKYNFDIKQEANNLLAKNGLNKVNFKSDTNNYFVDIENNPNRKYIDYLYEQEIISKNNKRFRPDNFIRLHEFSKLLVNSYRYKLGYNIKKNKGLTDKNYFIKTMPKYYNTAYEMGLLDGVDYIENFERFISYDDVEQILSNFYNQYPDKSNKQYINNIDIPKSSQTLKRGDACRAVVKSLYMDVEDNLQNNHSFQDIGDSTYGEAIDKLVELNILDQDNTNFYPDKRITRGEFIKLFVKTYLKSNNAELLLSNFDFNIDDLDYNSDCAKYVAYVQEKGLTNYFFETKRGKTYININKAVTKHEAYYIISQAAGVTMDYNIIQADKEYITKGELASILVDSFDFHFNYNQYNSHLDSFVDSFKSLTNTKKLLSLLF